MSQPQRGEVWLADCGFTAKVRPVAVVSIPLKPADRALITVIPHTTSLTGSEHEVAVPVRWLATGPFNVQAVFPLAPPRFLRLLGTLPADQLVRLETGLKRWEGLA
jgi:mRNA interferase MazF